MNRNYLAPLLGIGVALLILVPTTFAVGEPGSSLYANLGSNRFPGGATVASARLHFINANQISLDVFVQGNDVRNWTVRVYSEGTCTNVLKWAANRQANGSPLNRVLTNQGTVAQLLYFQDVNRIHAALANGETLAFMLAGEGAGTAQTNSPYRTCTAFQTTPPNFTTTTSTTSPTTTTATSNTSNTTTQITVTATTTTTANSTGTLTTTTTPSTTRTVTATTATGPCPATAMAILPEAVITQTATQTVTQTVASTLTTATVTAPTATTTATSTVPTCTTAATSATGTTTTGTTTTGTTTATVTTGPTTTTSTSATQTVTTVTAPGTTTTFTFP